MTFLNPLMLIGLLAAAIPLIIHLFNFRRPRRVDFSSLAFLKELEKTAMQRMRIKQWLLLALRVLAIVCLVLAFARPTLRGNLAASLGGQARASIALVLDNSLSMTLRDAQGEYLEQVRDVALRLVDDAKPGDEIFVLPTAGASEAPSTPYKNLSPARDAVMQVEPAAGAEALTRAVERAGALLEGSTHPNREIFILSDLQRSTLEDTTAGVLAEGIRTILLPVGDRSYGNVAVTDVQVTSRIVEAGQPVRVQALLVNYGDERIEGYVASLYLEGERVAQATADLEPGRPTSVTFTATPRQRGWLAGVVEIEDDAFPFDNERYFTLNAPEQRRVLIVRGEGEETRFLELALSPELSGGRTAFDATVISATALAAASLGQYDAVVLVGPRALSSGEVGALVRYVEQGGGLLLFPRSDASERYEALLAGIGGGRITGFSGTLGGSRPIAAFEGADIEHPLFEGMFDTPDPRTRGRIESPEIYHAADYRPGTGAEQTLITLSSGLPFLQEIRHGRGSVLFAAAAPDARWSDLPVRGIFIPLLYRSMYYLSATESAAGEQLTLGEAGELRLTGVPETESLRLVSPTGEEILPERRTLFGSVLLQLRAGIATEPGIYDVRAGDRLVRRVAFNLDERESDLRAYAADEAGERLSSRLGQEVTVIDAAGEEAGAVMRALDEQRTGVELWNVFLMLALLFLVSEMVVARSWRPETVTA